MEIHIDSVTKLYKPLAGVNIKTNFFTAHFYVNIFNMTKT